MASGSWMITLMRGLELSDFLLHVLRCIKEHFENIKSSVYKHLITGHKKLDNSKTLIEYNRKKKSKTK